MKTPLEYLPTTTSEWRSLLKVIKLEKELYVWDPFAGLSTTLRDELPTEMVFYSNDLNPAAICDTHLDATQPDYYTNFVVAHGDQGILITSMPFAFADLIAPMLIQELRTMLICLHVGPNFLSDGPSPRHSFLQQICKIRKIHIIHGNERNKSGHRGQWLIVCPENKPLRDYIQQETLNQSALVSWGMTTEI